MYSIAVCVILTLWNLDELDLLATVNRNSNSPRMLITIVFQFQHFILKFYTSLWCPCARHSIRISRMDQQSNTCHTVSQAAYASPRHPHVSPTRTCSKHHRLRHNNLHPTAITLADWALWGRCSNDRKMSANPGDGAGGWREAVDSQREEGGKQGAF